MGQTFSRSVPSKEVYHQVKDQLDRGEITAKEARGILGMNVLPEGGDIPVYGIGSNKPHEYIKAPHPGVMDAEGNFTSYDAALRSIEREMIFGDAEFGRNWTKADAGVAAPYSPLEHFKQELAKAKTVFDVSTVVERELYASQLFSLHSRPTVEYQKAIDEAAQRALRAEGDAHNQEVQAKWMQEKAVRPADFVDLDELVLRDVFRTMGKGPIATKEHADALRTEREEAEKRKDEDKRKERQKQEEEEARKEREWRASVVKTQEAEQREQDQFTSGLPWAYPDDFTAEEVESDNSTMVAELEDYRTTQSRAIMWDVVGTAMYCLAIVSIFVTVVGLIVHAPWWLFVVTGLAKLAYLGSRSWLEKAGKDE